MFKIQDRRSRKLSFCAFIFLLTACGSTHGDPSQKESRPVVAPASSSTAEANSAVGADTASAVPVASQTSVQPSSGSGENGTAARSESGAWTSLGAHLDKGGSAHSLSMAAPEGVPYVTWEEDGQVYVAFWDGTAWQGKEKSFNMDAAKPAFLPTLATDGRTLYLSWTEGREMKTLYVMKKEEGAWHPVASLGPGLGDRCSPANADLAVQQGIAKILSDSFCSDTQYASTIFFQWLGRWADPTGIGLQSHYADTPSFRKYAIASDEAGLYAAVIEGVKEETRLRVYRQEESEWTVMGDALNDAMMIASPFVLKLIEGTPYAAFQEGDLRVKHWNGSAWIADGPAFVSTVDAPLTSPALAGVHGIPYVGYAGAKAEVWFWNETEWTRKGEILNRPGTVSSSLSLAASSNILYAAWIEGEEEGAGGSIFVKKMTAQQ